MLIARQLTGSNSNTRPQAQLKLEKRLAQCSNKLK